MASGDSPGWALPQDGSPHARLRKREKTGLVRVRPAAPACAFGADSRLVSDASGEYDSCRA